MKNYEKINVKLDEQNMVEEFNQVELDIMLSCDEYNDMMTYASMNEYENLILLEE